MVVPILTVVMEVDTAVEAEAAVVGVGDRVIPIGSPFTAMSAQFQNSSPNLGWSPPLHATLSLVAHDSNAFGAQSFASQPAALMDWK